MPNLTVKSIEALKARGARIAVRDDGTPGLELRVGVGGAKTFAVRYTLADGTRRRMNIGPWPAVTLADAREAALAAMRDAARGGDPAGARLKERQTLRTQPVKTLDDLTAALFAGSRARLRPSTLTYWEWLNGKHIAPRLGRSRLAALNPGTIRKALREIEEAAGPTTANRAFALLRRAFNFGMEEEHLTVSPLARMKPLFDEATRARVLVDAEIKKLWLAAERTREPARKGKEARDDLDVSRAMAIAVQLCLVTAQRGGEVAGMRASEIDTVEKLWIIPASRTKAKREHVLPLTDLAIELIEEASKLARLRLGRAPKGDDPIFPTPRLGKAARDAEGALLLSPEPIARLSLGRAMARLCAAAGVSDAGAHDLRRTASTVMASERIGVLSEVVARILNHAPPGLGVTAIYNRHAYVAEKRSALVQWAVLLSQIVGRTAPASNVRKLARA